MPIFAHSYYIVMKKLNIILWALILGAALCQAEVRLPQIFQSGMVLQRGTAIPVWGQAAPNKAITVKLNKKTACTVADGRGNWRVDLPQMKAGGPYTLEVTEDATSTKTLTDVWVGDVWLCSGQSNMETTVERVSPQYPDELDDANAQVRLFHVAYQADPHGPSADLRPASWQPLNRENAWRFSAIGYFLGKQLQREKGVAQGIIESAWGGTPIEAWIAADSIAAHYPLYARQTLLYQNDQFVQAQQRAGSMADQQWQKVLNQYDPGMAKSGNGPLYAQSSFDDTDWPEVNQYRLREGRSPLASRRDFVGSVWLRQHIHIDAAHAGKPFRLLLGTLYDCDVTYLNGQQIGTTGYQYPPRRYDVAAGVLREGDNVLTVRFINKSGMPHFIEEKPYKMVFADNDILPLPEQWKIQTGTEMPRPIGMGISLQNQPSTLFNGMISPLAPFAVAGTVWYQGESNTGKAWEYAPMLRLLMANWRQAFQHPQMPFVIVQLANHMQYVERPQNTGWAQVREAQRVVAKEDARAELALAIDLGETVDIHPLRKKEVAQRIALAFDRLVYGRKVTLQPEVVKTEVADGCLVLTMDQPMQLCESAKFFEVAGPDGAFHNTTAQVNGNTITVALPVEQPRMLRYAWKDNPLGVNVYGQNGLPLSPFEIKIP